MCNFVITKTDNKYLYYLFYVNLRVLSCMKQINSILLEDKLLLTHFFVSFVIGESFVFVI